MSNEIIPKIIRLSKRMFSLKTNRVLNKKQQNNLGKFKKYLFKLYFTSK